MKLYIAILALVLVSSCSARTSATPNTGTTDTTGRTGTTTTDDTTTAVSYNANYELTGTYYPNGRNVADFFFYNDFLTTYNPCATSDSWGDCTSYNESAGCSYGFKEKYEEEGACMSSVDSTLNTYWSYTDIIDAKGWMGNTSGIEVFSPKKLHMTNNVTFEFSFNFDSEREILKEGARINIAFSANEKDFSLSYATLQKPMTLTPVSNGTKLIATFADVCGTLTFTGTIYDSDKTKIRSVTLSYNNFGEAYTLSQCQNPDAQITNNGVYPSPLGHSGTLVNAVTLYQLDN